MKSIKISIFIITLGLSGYTISKYYAQTDSSEGITVELRKSLTSDKSLKDFYLVWLQEQHTAIWCELEKSIGLTHDVFLQKKERETDYGYKNELVKFQNLHNGQTGISSETEKLIKSVMMDFSIDPSSIILLPFDHYCPAAANDYALFINEKLFNKLTSQAAKKFCIAHELQHFIHKDSTTMGLLLTLCNKEQKTDFPQDHPINKLSRFHELRADIQAAIKNDEYAEGYKEFVNFTISVIGEGTGITHPKNALRLTYAQDIAQGQFRGL